jgi:predicted small secreted protein
MSRILASALAALLGLAACNTVEGAGQDISGAGSAISDTAEDTENSM